MRVLTHVTDPKTGIKTTVFLCDCGAMIDVPLREAMGDILCAKCHAKEHGSRVMTSVPPGMLG